MSQYSRCLFPYNISGTSYVLSLPRNSQIVADLKMRRIDGSLFDMASSSNIDILAVSVGVWYGGEKTGTQFSALGNNISYIIDHTNVATSSIVRSFTPPAPALISMCDLADTDFYIVVDVTAIRISWSTDAIAA